MDPREIDDWLFDAACMFRLFGWRPLGLSIYTQHGMFEGFFSVAEFHKMEPAQ